MGKKKKSKSRIFEDSVLKTYFEVLSNALSNDRRSLACGPDGDISTDEGLLGPTKVGQPLRDARIYAVNPEQYVEFYRAADIYTTEKIAGLKWLPFDEGRDPLSTNEITIHYDRVTQAGKRIPIPTKDKWPFPSMWIGLGAISMSPLQMALRTSRKFLDVMEALGVTLVGIFFFTQENGEETVAEVFLVESEPTKILWRLCYAKGRWDNPYDLCPWIINALMGYIEDAGRTFVEVLPSVNAHLHRKVIQKKQTVVLPLPRPYYVINVQPKHIREGATKTMAEVSKKYEYTYRFDVSGHERVRYCRGTLPLEADLKATLLGRGYRVYEGVSPDGRDLFLLMERGIATNSETEWLAMKTCQVKPYIKGPQDKPYVPAIRKV